MHSQDCLVKTAVKGIILLKTMTHVHVPDSMQVAEAGFYYCGTAQTPDWVRCVVCHQDMEGWEPEDNPR